jgi:hypothetical protein
MRCPHCTIAMSPVSQQMGGKMFYDDGSQKATVQAVSCPECSGVFLTHTTVAHSIDEESGAFVTHESGSYVLLPRVSSRPPISPDVPDQYASLAREAGLILADSPRASAALSRRCLQQLLRNEAKAPHGKLYHEIEWALANADLPSRAKRSLHELREIGNMAAHPNKVQDSDDYLEVGQGEADWTLDVLDDLFDHYFVSPALDAARRADLAKKLGKAP